MGNGITRRSVLQGFGSMGLIALFRPKLRPSELVEIGEEDIIEEYYSHPSAIDMVIAAQYAFRAERIVIPSQIAPRWILEDITVGKATQFESSGRGVPGEAFSSDVMPGSNRTVLDPMMPGMEFRMRVRRSGLVKVGEAPEVFRAAIFGSTIDGPRRQMVLPISSDPWQVVG